MKLKIFLGKSFAFTIYVLIAYSNIIAYSQEILERGRFSGYMFGDYYYNIMRDPKVAQIPFANYKDPKDENGFEFRRIYFTYDYQISETFNSRLRFEIDRFTLSNNSKFTPFVKDAYLQWKDIFPGSNLTFGIQPTPTFDISEFVWENRHLEMTIIDYFNIISSRDFGISLKGKFDDNGYFNYWILLGNGSGTKPETDRYKTIYLNFLFKPSQNLYAYVNYHHKYQKPSSENSLNKILNRDEDLFSLFFSYRLKNTFKVGLEGFYNFVRNSICDSLHQMFLNRSMIGLSFFTIYYLSSKFNLVGRIDYFNPCFTDESENNNYYFYLLGLNYKPNQKVSLSPVFLCENYKKREDNGIKPSITFRLVFFYIF